MQVKEIVASGKAPVVNNAKLMVEEPEQTPEATINKPQHSIPIVTETSIQTPSASNAATKPTSPSLKGGLSKLREKIAAESSSVANQQRDIDPEGLKIAWQEYILKLKTAAKHSVVSIFEMMECRMKSPVDFEVVVYGTIQQGFFKQEKTALLLHVQHFFKNPNINIHVELIEDPEDDTPSDRPLTVREQFQLMTEKYPLVKELKDRLGMQLD